MFELTNEQRKCFALPPVADTWRKINVKPRPGDAFSTFAYLDGNSVKKVICVSDDPVHSIYREFQVNAMLSDDGQKILPKTEKGKPRLFNSGNLLTCTLVGMSLNYMGESLAITNNTSEQCYYCTAYDDVTLDGFLSFEKWLESWCKSTGEKEQLEIDEFATGKKIHQKYKEGDFFRFRISRNLYGYGRILIDFAKMRKEKTPFWHIFMGKPLCVAVYHIVTEHDDVKPSQLLGLPTLPSHMIMDNIFYYGECTIIGNEPITEAEKDYPIHYGRTIRAGEKGVRYQCGKTFIALEDEQPLYNDYRNGGIGWILHVKLNILKKCIETNSNQPFWDMYYPGIVDADLRNPRFSEKLKQIKRQLRIE